MNCAEERILAYQLATSIRQESLQEVSGGFGIIIPSITLTGDPMSPDMVKDDNS
jgi:hypothetical protein